MQHLAKQLGLELVKDRDQRSIFYFRQRRTDDLLEAAPCQDHTEFLYVNIDPNDNSVLQVSASSGYHRHTFLTEFTLLVRELERHCVPAFNGLALIVEDTRKSGRNLIIAWHHQGNEPPTELARFYQRDHGGLM